jgi:hypothetical protein
MWSSRGVSGLLLLSVSLLALAPGCKRRANGEGAEANGAGGEASEAPPPSGELPRVLAIGPGTGPALFMGSGESAPAFGYLNPGVRVRLESGVQNGRVEVLVAGPLPTKGWVPVDRLAAYVQERGRVDGTPFYVGPNDLVNLLGPGAEEGQMRIAVRPWLGGQTFLEPRVGTFNAELLADRPVEAGTVEAPTEGQCFRLPAGQSVPVYERPSGEPALNLPPQDPPATVVVLRDRAPWYGIRAGYGPYVVGYVQVPLTPCEGPRPAPEPMVPAPAGEAPSWMAQERGNLYRVAAGTRVTFGRDPDGSPRTIARLREQGWARELRRQDGDQIDAFIAVNEDVALRGLVPESALTLVQAGESAPPPAAAEPVPDEFAE